MLAPTTRARAQEPGGNAAATKPSESVEKRLSALDKQIGDLEESSRALRKELEKIDAARNALKMNAANLRAELGGAQPVKTGGEVKKAVRPGEPVEKADGSEDHVRLFPFLIRMFLIILILGCVGVIGRLFVTRWHEEEHEPMVEKETDLGTVRHPSKMQAAPDKVEPSAGPADIATAAADPAKSETKEEEKSIDFKDPADATGSGGAPGEKPPSKDYY